MQTKKRSIHLIHQKLVLTEALSIAVPLANRSKLVQCVFFILPEALLESCPQDINRAGARAVLHYHASTVVTRFALF